MTKWRGALVAGLGLSVASLGAINGSVGAEDPAPAVTSTATSKTADAVNKRKHDAARRVPAHFGQIGLTAEQRATIYTIQGRRLEAIDALEQQIAREKAEMIAQCEATLTETQRKLLDNLRRAATETGTARAPDPTPTK